MIYTVDTQIQTPVMFNPPTLADEVAQNIRTILSTPIGTAALARSIGLNYEAIDEPQQISEALLTAEVYTAIAEQEPRARVVDVSFGGTMKDAVTGRLLAVVRYTLEGEEE
ncbi:GPW/gp25 family protein [Paenibacillus sp. CN-4]|uniref:GPW/gp25 family protein n=1 Tax=Paenibacillus nanchangensis TaxID=3348343 RepID=UPI00397D1045